MEHTIMGSEIVESYWYLSNSECFFIHYIIFK